MQQILRTTLIEYRDQKPLTWPLSHVTHCMHTMREDVLCAADDTPRYTGALNHEAGKDTSGIGELHTCRNWDKLRQYAVDHSACYRVPLFESSKTIDRYKSCPNGANALETVRRLSRGKIVGLFLAIRTPCIDKTRSYNFSTYNQLFIAVS